MLLSDGFLETHCFRLVRDDDDGRRRVGLKFSPLPSRSLPDIEGVIWLDAATFGPLHVEYTFTHHLRAFDVPEERFGGRTEFERLDNGAWVTSRWLLRMPDFVETTRNRPSFAQPRTPVGSGNRLVAARDAGLIVNEQGGDLVFVRVPTGERGRGEVRGVVWDSTRRGRWPVRQSTPPTAEAPT